MSSTEDTPPTPAPTLATVLVTARTTFSLSGGRPASNGEVLEDVDIDAEAHAIAAGDLIVLPPLDDLDSLSRAELDERALEVGVPDPGSLSKKADVADAIRAATTTPKD